MMLWAVWCIDSDSAPQVRGRYAQEHSAYLAASPLPLWIAGPLRSDDGGQSRGSLMIYEAEHRAEVEAHVAADPFARSGIWRSTEISVFKMTRNNIPAGEDTLSS